MICAFLAGGIAGGVAVHLWWRRWNRRRKIHIDTDGPDYIEDHDCAVHEAPTREHPTLKIEL